MIVPVGERPPLKTAVSLIVPPTMTPGEAVVTIVGLAGGGGGAAQFGIVRLVEYELALPSVVWLEVQLDEATTRPAALGIAIVVEYESSGKETFPVVVTGAPPVGV